MSESLKNCPFCGSLPEGHFINMHTTWISCGNANCPASVIRSSAETWNCRAPNKDHKKLAEEKVFFKEYELALKYVRNQAHTQANCILTADDEIEKSAQIRNYYGGKFREIQRMADEVLKS